MKIYPFAAIRSPAHRVSEVSCPPYDVVDRTQAAEIAAAKPNTFMRVVRAEVDFASDSDPHSLGVYQRARANFLDLLARGYLVSDPTRGMYVYRQSKDGRRQAGLVCCFRSVPSHRNDASAAVNPCGGAPGAGGKNP